MIRVYLQATEIRVEGHGDPSTELGMRACAGVSALLKAAELYVQTSGKGTSCFGRGYACITRTDPAVMKMLELGLVGIAMVSGDQVVLMAT